jgi:hypothetical protein
MVNVHQLVTGKKNGSAHCPGWSPGRRKRNARMAEARRRNTNRIERKQDGERTREWF